MKRYGNLHGNSGVVAYEEGRNFIRVQFKKGGIYLYTYDSAGEEEVEFMKELAREGKGLASFIREIGERYANRER